jgi:hypothetical protein
MTPDSVCPGQLCKAYEDWALRHMLRAAGVQRLALTLSATECTECHGAQRLAMALSANASLSAVTADWPALDSSPVVCPLCHQRSQTSPTRRQCLLQRY